MRRSTFISCVCPSSLLFDRTQCRATRVAPDARKRLGGHAAAACKKEAKTLCNGRLQGSTSLPRRDKGVALVVETSRLMCRDCLTRHCSSSAKLSTSSPLLQDMRSLAPACSPDTQVGGDHALMLHPVSFRLPLTGPFLSLESRYTGGLCSLFERRTNHSQKDTTYPPSIYRSRLSTVLGGA